MRGIKIPQQDFALKRRGGGGGGLFAGHYGICIHKFSKILLKIFILL